MELNKKRTALTIGALILSCTMLFGCGREKKEEQATHEAEASSVETSSFDAQTPKSTDAETPDKTPEASAQSVSSESIPSRVDSELADAESFVSAGMYDDAREMLSSVNRDELSGEQLEQYQKIETEIYNASQSAAAADSFTPEMAVRIVEDAYGIQIDGDLSGLMPEKTSSGAEFYRMQIQVDSQNAKKTVNVYQNGDIEEISSEPIAFG